MTTVLTLTVNPALDVSSAVPYVLPDQKLRCDAPCREPGGGGINVARVLRRLGGDPLAWFPVGGPTGERLQGLLDEEGVRQSTIATREWTRENVNVLERATGRQFRFCMPGPHLAEAEWRPFLEGLALVAPRPRYLVASGSLPPGVPVDFYARLAVRARELGIRLVLDTSGDALVRAAAAGVFLLKPSLREFRALTGTTAEDEATLIALARAAVRERRWCDVLVLSLGAAGALWVSGDGGARLGAPAVPVQGSVGAGDSMVAGIVHALDAGRPLADAARLGVAAGAAAVLNPGTALCRRDDVERLLPQVTAVPL
jgi:6-phosphofructokinase 2